MISKINLVGITDVALLAKRLVVDMNPVVVEVHIHECVAIVTTSHVETSHHQAIDAIGLILAPAVPVTVLMSDNGIFLEHRHIVAVVVEVVE